VPELKGFSPPFTETSRSALIPNPPWLYSGDLLTVEYRTDADKVRAILPPDVELAGAAGSISGTPPFWARPSSSAVGSDINQVFRSRPTSDDPQIAGVSLNPGRQGAGGIS
jgi:hypothetical protein